MNENGRPSGLKTALIQVALCGVETHASLRIGFFRSLLTPCPFKTLTCSDLPSGDNKRAMQREAAWPVC
jgi:hypothetical protein